MPPIYEYKCAKCGEVREELRPISQCSDPLIQPCVNRPLSKIEIAAGLTQEDRGQCTFTRIMSATPTTFRFNDSTGFKGLDKRVNRK